MDLVCEDILGEVTCKELKCGDTLTQIDYVNYFFSLFKHSCSSTIHGIAEPRLGNFVLRHTIYSLVLHIMKLQRPEIITSTTYQLINSSRKDPSKF